MKRFWYFLALSSLFIVEVSFAGESGLDLGGSLKVDTYIYADINTNVGILTNIPIYAGMDTLRLKVRNRDRKFAKFEAMVDLYLLHGEFADRYFATLASSSTGMAFRADLLKLYIKLKPDFGDVSLGRQIIRFGQGFLFSPIDVFSTPDLSDISFSRRGSDSLRVEIPVGALGEFEMVTTLSTRLTNLRSAVKFSQNLFGWDTSIEALYRYFTYETLLGWTFKGDLGLGWHGEAVLHILSNGNDFYGEVVLGADMSFLDGNLILMAEYYYNERVVDTLALTPLNIGSVNRQWYARHYVFAQVQFVVDDLTAVGVNGVLNFPDKAWILGILLNRSLYQNVNLSGSFRWYEKNINGVSWLENHNLESLLRVELLF